jgi:hypothetical protein
VFASRPRHRLPSPCPLSRASISHFLACVILRSQQTVIRRLLFAFFNCFRCPHCHTFRLGVNSKVPLFLACVARQIFRFTWPNIPWITATWSQFKKHFWINLYSSSSSSPSVRLSSCRTLFFMVILCLTSVSLLFAGSISLSSSWINELWRIWITVHLGRSML